MGAPVIIRWDDLTPKGLARRRVISDGTQVLRLLTFALVLQGWATS